MSTATVSNTSASTPELRRQLGLGSATPIAFLAIVMVLLVALAVRYPHESAIGTLVALAGVPAYSFIRPKLKNENEVDAKG